jgi:uncharacterized protein (DUF362 family)
MERDNHHSTSNEKFSRRKFLRTMGTTTAGLLVAPYISSSNIFAYGHKSKSLYLTKVAITEADNYERSYIKQKVQHLFESIDGITDIVKSGNKVAIKINLTGGGGLPDNMWTHPEVLRAVGELIIDCGVNAQDIYIVEALWSDFSYNNNGYLDVQNSLGANMVNLNNADPYDDFMDKEVGDNKFFYSSFKVNQILNEADVYVSIPKMKQHYEAGVTCSLKNQVGMVPKQFYTIEGDQGRRAALHNETGGPSNTHLPRSICDLNLARPVHLAVIDGIVNARGGEGTWNPTFQPCEDHVLLAGKDPVATDSVASYFMGNDPEAETLLKPDGGQCDNHLHLLHQIGVGTNQMNEIEIVGDGAGLITSVRPDYSVNLPTTIKLLQNYPNPFNPSTIIRFYLPQRKFVNIKIYSINGQEIETLINGEVPAGQHELHWAPNGQASGVYIYKMIAGNFVDTKKMIYQK